MLAPGPSSSVSYKLNFSNRGNGVGFRLMPMAEGRKDLPGHRRHRRYQQMFVMIPPRQAGFSRAGQWKRRGTGTEVAEGGDASCFLCTFNVCKPHATSHRAIASSGEREIRLQSRCGSISTKISERPVSNSVSQW
jgi:hypothetical protein